MLATILTSRSGENADPARGRCPVFARTRPKIPFFCPAVDTPWGLLSLPGVGKWGDCQMIVKASGRSALILATGLFVCFAGPSQAAGATDPAESATAGAPIALNKYAKHTAHHKKLAQRKSSKVASKSSTDTKAAPTDTAADDSDNSST